MMCPDGWRAVPAGRIEGCRRREGHSRLRGQLVMKNNDECHFLIYKHATMTCLEVVLGECSRWYTPPGKVLLDACAGGHGGGGGQISFNNSQIK